MNKGRNIDFHEAKWLNFIIPQLFWSIRPSELFNWDIFLS